MDALNRMRSAWGTGAEARPLEPLALHLWLSGRLDLAELRRVRLLSTGPSGRLLLLLLSCQHRSGAPRSLSSALRRILSDRDPWIFLPEGVDAGVARAELSASLGAIRTEWDALVEAARRDPREVAAWCGRPGEAGSLVEFEDGDDPQWAFRRSAEAERALERAFRGRLRAPMRDVPVERARSILGEVLAGGDPPDFLQARAVALALRTSFLVVSGGPGTGKTTVVVRILRALRRLLDLRPEETALCAPTGRAHARLLESVGAALPPQGDDADLRRCAGGTLHSLLGARGDGSFRHGEDSPLPHRLVVVDESSMVDIHMFAALVRSLRAETALVLLGDRDQLPSVEAGAVLSDLCAGASGDLLSPEAAAWTESVLDGIPTSGRRPVRPSSHPLSDRLVVLERSFRSVEGISEAAREILEGREDWALRLPEAEAGPGGPSAGRISAPLREVLPGWFDRHMEEFRAWDGGARDPEGLGRLLRARRILCAVHAGESGREAVCRELDLLLCGAGRPRHLPGRPVIAVRNRPDLGLRNGDLGVVVSAREGLRAAFADGGAIRWIDPALAPELEPAWAMTVHKSQGSEFDEVLFSAPDVDCAVLDRPALYTAVTRARRILRVCGDPGILGRASRRVPQRPSRLSRTGLTD